MWYRLYGLTVFLLGCLAWWFVSPPVGKSPGTLLLLYVGGFSAIGTGIAFTVGGAKTFKWYCDGKFADWKSTDNLRNIPSK